MRFFPLTDSDREDMKKEIGISDIKELFSDLPEKNSYFPLDDIPHLLEENELIAKFDEIGKKNSFKEYLSFLGGGAYNHFIPEVVNYLSNRGEFVTPYTPYQPEVSQGSLQAIFEYQTMISILTGLDVSNSSLYDGGTAAAEGLLLAIRKTRKNKILVAKNIHPEYFEIIKTYTQNLEISIEEIEYDQISGKTDIEDLKKKVDENTAGLLFQSPNFFGIVEDSSDLSDIIHKSGGLSVQVISEAFSLPFLTSPGDNQVDIAVGEAQSFGLPLSFGGPYLGFMAARKELVRQMPGRLVGETVDSKGRRGYVLTLSTREQHIKREKATSNICSNQAWCALRAAIFLSVLGKDGMMKISKSNHLNAAYFKKLVSNFEKIKIKFSGEFFNEIVIELTDIDVTEFLDKMKNNKILAGIPLKWFFKNMKNSILINFTELHSKSDIEKFAKLIGEL